MNNSTPSASEIETDRLLLEVLCPAHAPLLFEGLDDKDLYHFTDDPPPENVESLRSRYVRLAKQKSPDGSETWLNWAIQIRADHRYVGFVQATISNGRSAEIAYLIFRNDWGCGYAREAVTAMIGRLQDTHKINTFSARVHRRNDRSIALLESLRFQKRQCAINGARDPADSIDELNYVLSSKTD